MKTLNLQQGTAEWAQLRGKYRTASEASVMMGGAAHTSRAELIRLKASGAEKEYSRWHEEVLFPRGHAVEASARPIAEKIIGEELFPAVALSDDEYLLASFDGITMLEDAGAEIKQWNEDKATHVRETGTPPPVDLWQVVQQLAVSGAARWLYLVSDGTEERSVHCWVPRDEAQIARLRAGWRQFDADLAAYTPAPAPAVAVGRSPETLPALFVQISGGVQASNLPEFKAAAIEVFRDIRTDLATDQDFADAEQAVKFCADVESKLKAAKEHALGQTASIDELFRTIDAISAEARAKRLELEKLVKARKDEIRAEIVAKAVRDVDAFRSSLNANLAVPLAVTDVRGQLADAIKGKRTITSLQDAAAQVVANAKIAASAEAERHRANLSVFAELGRSELFGDREALVRTKVPEDLRNLGKARIAEADEREESRREQERQQIRAEEEARANREAQAAKERELEAERTRIREEERQRLQSESRANTASAPRVATSAFASTSSRQAVDASAAAEAVPQSVADAAPTQAGPRIKLGDINARIAPLSISAEGLGLLGFHPVGNDRAAKLYAASAFPAICRALVDHLKNASADLKAAA